MTLLVDTALALAAAGIPVFPCRSAPGTKDHKAPCLAGGFHAASIDPATIREAFSTRSAALIGVPTGPASGFDVFDLDPRHGSDEWWTPNQDRIPATRIHTTRQGGKHILFKHAQGLRCSTDNPAPGCDIRADGGYMIWWPDFGGEVWLDYDIVPWPAWLLDSVQAVRPSTGNAEPAVNAAAMAGPSTEDVVAVLTAMPNPESVGRDDYVKIAMATAGAMHGLDEDAIGNAWIDWAERWPRYDGSARDKWQDDFSRRERALAGWPHLLRHAAKLGVDTAQWRAREFEDGVALPPPVTKRTLALIHPADCETGPRRGYIVKNLIAPGDVAAIVGPPSTGKSMLAPYLAYAVAQGRPVFGLRTRPGRTLYVAAEDASGMRQRVHALKLNHGDAPDFALTATENLRDKGNETLLLDTVADWNPALVVIDTVGAAWAGMDENASGDMGEVVSLARRLASNGRAVLLVHHTAKHGDGTPRGHSSLNGTLDMALRLEPRDEGGVIRGVLGKNRNGTTDRAIAFRYVGVGLGEDEDGDPITAPMAVELAAGDTPVRAPRLSPTERRAFDILVSLGGEFGQVPESDWRAACIDQAISTSDDPKNRGKVVAKVIKSLLDKAVVVVGGGTARACVQL